MIASGGKQFGTSETPHILPRTGTDPSSICRSSWDDTSIRNFFQTMATCNTLTYSWLRAPAVLTAQIRNRTRLSLNANVLLIIAQDSS
jgi:hypothetical protein